MKLIVLLLLTAASLQAKTIHLRFLVENGGQSVSYRDQYTVDPKLEVWRFTNRVMTDYSFKLQQNQYVIARETPDGLQVLDPQARLGDYGSETDAAILLHVVPKKDAQASPPPQEAQTQSSQEGLDQTPTA